MSTETKFLKKGFLFIKQFYLDLYVYNFYHINNILIWELAIRRAVSFWFVFSKMLIVIYFIHVFNIDSSRIMYVSVVVIFFALFQIVDFLYLDDKVNKENVKMLYRTLKNKTPLRITTIIILVLSIYSLCTVV